MPISQDMGEIGRCGRFVLPNLSRALKALRALISKSHYPDLECYHPTGKPNAVLQVGCLAGCTEVFL